MKDDKKTDPEFLKNLIMPDENHIPPLEDTPSDILWKKIKESGIYRTDKE